MFHSNKELYHSTNLSDYLEAIEGREEFFAAHRPDSGIVILNYNYVMPDSFPDPNSFSDPNEARKAALRRNCRGMKFDMVTGECVVAPYMKFFNVSERPETMMHAIDWTKPHWILSKLDGSFCHDHIRPDGKREWHTKMGATDVAKPIEKHVAKIRNQIDYDAFNDKMRNQNITALYEWCSRIQRIVIDYPEDQLILTALRSIETGKYIPYPEMVDLANEAGIPVVYALPGSVENIEIFMKQAKDLIGEEGYVIRFLDGSMYKVKAEDYCIKHKVKDGLNYEKDIWAMVLADTIDDALPLMDEEAREASMAFSGALNSQVQVLANSITEKVAAAKLVCPDKKSFAAIVNGPTVNTWEKPLMFAVWDGKDALAVTKGYLEARTTSQTKVDGIRAMVGGLNWNQFYRAEKLDD